MTPYAKELHAAASEAVAQAIDELGLGDRKVLRGSKRVAVEDRALEIMRIRLPAPPQEGENYACCSGHCCAMHGCKYGKEACPVVCGRERQMYPCEQCEHVPDVYVLDEVFGAAEMGHRWAQETIQHAWALTVYLVDDPRVEPPTDLTELLKAMRDYVYRLRPQDQTLVFFFIRERMCPPPSGD